MTRLHLRLEFEELRHLLFDSDIVSHSVVTAADVAVFISMSCTEHETVDDNRFCSHVGERNTVRRRIHVQRQVYGADCQLESDWDPERISLFMGI